MRHAIRRFFPALLLTMLCGGGSGAQEARLAAAPQLIKAPASADWSDTRLTRILGGCVISMLLWHLYRIRIESNAPRPQSLAAGIMAERERIARELHDTLIQSIHGLMLTLQASISDLSPSDRLRVEIDSALDRVARALDETRDLVSGLRLSTLPLDFAKAMSDWANLLSVARRADFKLAVTGTPRPLQPMNAEQIYGIAREALANAFAHAEASVIQVEIKYQKAGLCVYVRDDGCGMGPVPGFEDRASRHFGLRGMRERAAQIDAQLSIHSVKDMGTRIALEIPAINAYLPVTSDHRRSHLFRNVPGLVSNALRPLISAGGRVVGVTRRYLEDREVKT